MQVGYLSVDELPKKLTLKSPNRMSLEQVLGPRGAKVLIKVERAE